MAGFLANQELPAVILQNFINLYRCIYKIDLAQSCGEQSDYKTFNQFFQRDIDFKKRKIDKTTNNLISPVDGIIIRFGELKKNAFYSAKGIDFTLEELVGKENSKFFVDGAYLAIYLSPADHHRIYAPFDGEIFNFSYFDGKLLPVNKFGLKFFPKLFCVNERLLSLMRDSQKRTVGILKIGAIIVGGIRTKYSSLAGLHLQQNKIFSPVEPIFQVQKAQEIASFELGSMVFLLFQKGEFITNDFFVGDKIKVGEKIGSFVSKK